MWEKILVPFEEKINKYQCSLIFLGSGLCAHSKNKTRQLDMLEWTERVIWYNLGIFKRRKPQMGGFCFYSTLVRNLSNPEPLSWLPSLPWSDSCWWKELSPFHPAPPPTFKEKCIAWGGLRSIAIHCGNAEIALMERKPLVLESNTENKKGILFKLYNISWARGSTFFVFFSVLK